MKVGDLVIFRNCSKVGQTGIISVCVVPSHLAMENPSLRVYWVLCGSGVKCFTGNQLVLINESR